MYVANNMNTEKTVSKWSKNLCVVLGLAPTLVTHLIRDKYNPWRKKMGHNNNELEMEELYVIIYYIS